MVAGAVKRTQIGHISQPFSVPKEILENLPASSFEMLPMLLSRPSRLTGESLSLKSVCLVCVGGKGQGGSERAFQRVRLNPFYPYLSICGCCDG